MLGWWAIAGAMLASPAAVLLHQGDVGGAVLAGLVAALAFASAIVGSAYGRA